MDSSHNLQGTPLVFSGAETYTLRAENLDFQLFIHLGPSRGLPTVYVLDGNLSFVSAVDTTKTLRLGNSFPDLNIVGIGYPSHINASVARFRDFTPTRETTLEEDPHFLRRMNCGPGEFITGGAATFLTILQRILIPFADQKTGTPSQRFLMGNSLGGLFGLYTMITAPNLFTGFALGSPTLDWTNDYISGLCRSNKDLQLTGTKLFLSIGELEAENLEKFSKFQGTIRSSFPTLALWTCVFQGETHLSVIPSAICRGFRVLIEAIDELEIPLSVRRVGPTAEETWKLLEKQQNYYSNFYGNNRVEQLLQGGVPRDVVRNQCFKALPFHMRDSGNSLFYWHRGCADLFDERTIVGLLQEKIATGYGNSGDYNELIDIFHKAGRFDEVCDLISKGCEADAGFMIYSGMKYTSYLVKQGKIDWAVTYLNRMKDKYPSYDASTCWALVQPAQGG